MPRGVGSQHHARAFPAVDLAVPVGKGEAATVAVGGGWKINPHRLPRADGKAAVVDAEGAFIQQRENHRGGNRSKSAGLAKGRPRLVPLIAMTAVQMWTVDGQGRNAAVT